MLATFVEAACVDQNIIQTLSRAWPDIRMGYVGFVLCSVVAAAAAAACGGNKMWSA